MKKKRNTRTASQRSKVGSNVEGRRITNRGKQGSKDSDTKRVNYDNTRLSKFEKDVEDMERRSYPKGAKPTKGVNDIRWYANNPELLRAAASVPFAYTLGTPLPWKAHNNRLMGVPGVMTMYWTPYLGYNDPAIVAAANSTYSYVVHANSRTTQYDPNDLLLLILAGAQIFSAFALGVRAYGLMRRYDQQDSYTPGALIEGMGFNYEDLKTNVSHMWFDLNQISAQLQQIWIPNTMPIIERWFWMNSNVYADGDSVKSQYYQFAPTVFYQYSETASSNGGSLQPIKWMQLTEDTSAPVAVLPVPTRHTWDEYVTIINNMLTALLNSQDRGIIFGDILKAYGEGSLYSVSPINVDYTVEPVYDKEVLSQIENATFFSNAFGLGAVTRTHDIGPIVQMPGATGLQHQFLSTSLATSASTGNGQANGAGEFLPLNFHQKEFPTPEQIMIATRLRSVGTRVLGYGTSGGSARLGYYGPAIAGTEVLVWASSALTYNDPSDVQLVQLNVNILTTARTATPSGPVSFLATVWEWASFDWAPMILIAAENELAFPSTNLNPATVSPVFGDTYEAILDYDNYTILSADSLKRMHQTAIYSLFGVPTF